MLGRALMQSRSEDTYIKADAIIFSDFLAYARSRARRLTYIFLTLFGLAALVSALIPPRYKATATLAILPSPEFTVRQDAGSHTATAAMLALDQIMKSEIAILSSDDLYKSTIDDFGVGRLYPEIVEHAPSPWLARIALSAWHWVSRPWLPESRQSDADRALKKFSDHIRISPSKDSNVIDIAYANKDAATAASALNRMLHFYSERRRQVYDDPQLAAVRAQAHLQADAASLAEQNLTVFKRRESISNYDTQRTLLLHRRDSTVGDLADTRAAIAAENARLTVLDANLRADPPAVLLYHEHDATQVDAIDASLLDLRGRLTTALQHYRPTSHLVRDIQSQIHERELNRQKAFSDDHASTTRMGRSTAKDSMLTQRATSAADAAALRAKEAVLRQTLQQLDSELDLLDAAEATLAELERKKNVAEDAYSSTQHTLSEQGLTEAEDTQRLAKVRLVQPANIPTEPEPTKILILLAGFVIAVMAVIATALTRFAMNPLIFTAEGLAEITDLPILGTLEVDRRSSPVQ